MSFLKTYLHRAIHRGMPPAGIFRGKCNNDTLRLKHNKKIFDAAASCYAGGAERCGDSYGWELIPEGRNVTDYCSVRNKPVMVAGKTASGFSSGRLAVALSDGMGKGEAAARDSERAVKSILPLLKAGMDPEMALQVLNMLWSMSNRKEMFPTMDLALLDPVSRELMIYKIGAAPTVIVRAPHRGPGQSSIEPFPPEQIEILTAPAMPMGVSEYSEIPCISTLVMQGDLIIMMTDGVSDSLRSASGNSRNEKISPMHRASGHSIDESRNSLQEYPELDWMRRLFSRIKSQNLQTICDLIIREATLNYGGREKDDMAVVVVRV